MELKLRDYIKRKELEPGIEIDDLAELQEEYATAAQYLTRPAVEKESGQLLYETITEDKVLQQRATDMLVVLDRELDSWHRNMDPESEWFLTIVRAVKAADVELREGYEGMVLVVARPIALKS